MIKTLILWLAFIFACFLPASALTPTAPENRIWEIFTFGYDAPVAEATNLESRAETSTSNYDTAPTYRATNEEIPTEANRALFGQNAEFKAAESVTTPIGELRSAGLADAHHVVQDAAVRDLPGYDTNLAPGVQLQGPSTAIGSPHYLATQAQRAAGGGTYGAERQIAIQSLKAAGFSDAQAAQAQQESDAYFNSIGVTDSTVTRIPGNRRSP